MGHMHSWGNTILLCALVSSVSKRDVHDVTITLNLQACHKLMLSKLPVPQR